MSCTNPNCNSGCGCNGCCPPVTPPTPPTPPICVGTQCEEIYDAACVNYTGPALTCFNIPTNTNLNSVIETIANRLCSCYSSSQCTSPLQLFFERFKTLYYDLYNTDNTIPFNDVFQYYLNNGIIVKKCQYCCPDVFIYALSAGPTMCYHIATTYSSGYPNVEPPCRNCWTKYSTCATTLLTKFDPLLGGVLDEPLTIEDLCEFGGFNNVTALCELTTILTANFTYAQITDIMLNIRNYGLAVACDESRANVLVGAFDTIDTFATTYLYI